MLQFGYSGGLSSAELLFQRLKLLLDRLGQLLNVLLILFLAQSSDSAHQRNPGKNTHYKPAQLLAHAAVLPQAHKRRAPGRSYGEPGAPCSLIVDGSYGLMYR